MKKNIILALILAASMTATITSCGKSGEEVSSKPAQEVSNGTEQSSYNDAMGIEETITETEPITEAEVEEEAVIEPTQEILETDIDSRKIQLGNKVYTLPITLQTLLDDGATITNDVNPINDVLDSLQGDYVEFVKEDQKYYVCFFNLSSNKKQIKDCFMADTSPYQVDTKINNNIIYSKGIKVGSTVEELKAAWGEPTEDDLNELNYNDKYFVSIDLEKQLITDIYYRIDPDFRAGYYYARYSVYWLPESLKVENETSTEEE